MIWLFQHPVALAVLAVVMVVVVISWFCGPVTWRDGEGPITPDDGDMRHWVWRLFPWWR